VDEIAGEGETKMSGSAPSSSTVTLKSTKVPCPSTAQRRDKKSHKSASATDEVAIPVSQNGRNGGGRPGTKKRDSDGHERLSMAKQPVMCGICKNKIVDGKDEALYCEGRCQSSTELEFQLSSSRSLKRVRKLSINVLPFGQRCMQAQKILALEDTVTAQVSELKAAFEHFVLTQKDYERLASMVKRM